jgi:UrcA family protein
MKRMILFAATAALASAASASIADIVVIEGPAARVSYGDLNLQSTAGRQQLQRRIRSAAEMLCDEGGVQRLEVKVQVSTCYHAAVSSGMEQLNSLVSDDSGGSLAGH